MKMNANLEGINIFYNASVESSILWLIIKKKILTTKRQVTVNK